MKGVLNKNALTGLVAANRLVSGVGFDMSHIGPASVDLAIGNELYGIQRVLTPNAQKKQTVRALLHEMGASQPLSVEKGVVLTPGNSYIALASVSANFAPGMYAYANAKSTTGRHFVLVRTLSDECIGYDTIDQRDRGYTGEIWLVIQPLVYPVVVSTGQCLSQLRVFTGDTRFSRDDLKMHLMTNDVLLRRNGIPYNQGELSLESGDGTFFMTVFAPPRGFMGYRAIENLEPIDLSVSAGSVDPSNYFEPVYAEEDGTLELLAGEYYLLSTKEIVRVPVDLSAEIRAMDTRLGIFFSHFAGFIDPGFSGTITLEVMAPLGMTLRRGDPVARLLFEKVVGATDSYALTGNYAKQIQTGLPKQFTVHPTLS